jgi:[ribosomal protein S18]-alanine N-acetyltransferase
MFKSAFMNIRPYRQTDKERIIELFRLNTPAFFASEEEDELVLYLNDHAQHYFVAETGDKIIGSGGYNLFPEDETARISWDIFHPHAQGKGLGSALTNFRIEELRKTPGVKHIVVRTSQLAYRFYEKFGFTTTKIINDYWAEGFHLYHMEYEAKVVL